MARNLAYILQVIAIFLIASCVSPQQVSARHDAAIVRDDGETYTLSNGIVVAVISKRSADLLSLTYKGIETLTSDSGGHSAAYWSHDVTGGSDLIPRVSLDPAANGGERAEVSIKGVSGGRKMGHGPGTPVDGDIAVDIDIRWSLGRGDSGIYTYTAFEHRPEYPGGTMAEARIAVELSSDFDTIHVDAARSGAFPLLNEGIDKYVYTALQAEERAYGWTSSTRKKGWFLLNPSAEYLSGGPTKAEFLAHGRPTVLNYWKSSHYYGANVTLIEGEPWTKVVGPFMFYVNAGESHKAMVENAKAQLAHEEAKWPYTWVNAKGFAPPATRSEVKGRLALNDSPSPAQRTRYSGALTVGLTKTPYAVPAGDGRTRFLEWQNDGKFYQFWSRNADPSGNFIIPKVAPGTYTLHAFADGVLGEFTKTDIVVGEAGGSLDLGELQWVPVRHGRQLWEIGSADRSGKEFRQGDRYFEPGVQLRYPEFFPHNVTFWPARSNPGEEWFFAHAPTPRDGVAYEVRAFSGVIGEGDATPYAVKFELDAPPRGRATLRLAVTTNSAFALNVAVNGRAAGSVPLAPPDSSLARHQMYGRWFETWLSFDADLLIAGENVLTLTVPSGPINNAIVYDYLRLELDEGGGPVAAPAAFPPRLSLGPAPSGRAVAPYEIRTFHDDTRLGLPHSEAGGIRFTEGADDQGISTIFMQAANDPASKAIDPRVFGGRAVREWRPSPDGSKVAYALADGPEGDGWKTIHVWDVAAGRQLPDELRWIRNTSIAWSADSRGFYYSKYRDPSPDPEVQRFNTAQEVFYHALGRDRFEDRRVYASDRGSVIHYAETSGDGRWLVINASVDGNGRSEIVLVDLTQHRLGPFKAIRTMRDGWQFAGAKGDLLYFVTTFDAASRRVAALDTSRSSLPLIEVVPAESSLLEAARISGDWLLLSYAGPAGPKIESVWIGAEKQKDRASSAKENKRHNGRE